jgi:hypothetical protein
VFEGAGKLTTAMKNTAKNREEPKCEENEQNHRRRENREIQKDDNERDGTGRKAKESKRLSVQRERTGARKKSCNDKVRANEREVERTRMKNK